MCPGAEEVGLALGYSHIFTSSLCPIGPSVACTPYCFFSSFSCCLNRIVCSLTSRSASEFLPVQPTLSSLIVSLNLFFFFDTIYCRLDSLNVRIWSILANSAMVFPYLVDYLVQPISTRPKAASEGCPRWSWGRVGKFWWGERGLNTPKGCEMSLYWSTLAFWHCYLTAQPSSVISAWTLHSETPIPFLAPFHADFFLSGREGMTLWNFINTLLSSLCLLFPSVWSCRFWFWPLRLLLRSILMLTLL